MFPLSFFRFRRNKKIGIGHNPSPTGPAPGFPGRTPKNMFSKEYYEAVKRQQEIEVEEEKIIKDISDLDVLSNIMTVLIEFNVKNGDPKEPIEEIRRILNDRV